MPPLSSCCTRGNLFRSRHMGLLAWKWRKCVCASAGVCDGICCYCLPRTLLVAAVPLMLSAAICRPGQIRGHCCASTYMECVWVCVPVGVFYPSQRHAALAPNPSAGRWQPSCPSLPSSLSPSVAGVKSGWCSGVPPALADLQPRAQKAHSTSFKSGF